MAFGVLLMHSRESVGRESSESQVAVMELTCEDLLLFILI
jgi:hypothetical protein